MYCGLFVASTVAVASLLPDIAEIKRETSNMETDETRHFIKLNYIARTVNKTATSAF